MTLRHLPLPGSPNSPRAARRHAWLGVGLLGVAVSVACGPSASEPANSGAPASAPSTTEPSASPVGGSAAAPATSGPAPSLDIDATLAAIDARRLDPAWLDVVRAGRADDRALAALALARLARPDLSPALADALSDPSPAVRQRAAMGLGALETDAPEAATTALIAALAAEPEPSVRGTMLAEVGRLGARAETAPLVFPALRAGLASTVAPEREGACRGLARVGSGGQALDSALLTRLAALAADDPERAVRFACASALVRAPSPPPGVAADLLRAAHDPDADVRAMVARALGRVPTDDLSGLAALADDPDWLVALHAVRGLASRDPSGTTLARALERVASRTIVDGEVAPGGPAHLLLGALETPSAAQARHEAVFAAANLAFGLLDARTPNRAPSRERGLAHCAAARLVDLGRAWPSALDRCGLDRVSAPEREVRRAALLGAIEGAEAERFSLLRRLATSAHGPTRQAVAQALGTLATPEADEALARLVADADVGVSTAALESLSARVREAAGASADRALAAVLDPSAATVAPAQSAWPSGRLRALLAAHLSPALGADRLEPLVTALGVLEASLDGSLADLAQPLTLHPVAAVRSAAGRALRALDAPVPEGALPEAPNPIDPATLTPRARLARVSTARGTFVIALRPDVAPTTVARFVGLARAGFYAGLSFHRVVDGFVAQGGDPRGDGYGGPGWAQRCEDNLLRYERGTVGMALAGRDTGGSQFFVTVSPQPHLDGRYTAFGRVVEGIDVVDRLLPGDTLDAIEIELGEPLAAGAVE